jgi:hypothetical protein
MRPRSVCSSPGLVYLRRLSLTDETRLDLLVKLVEVDAFDLGHGGGVRRGCGGVCRAIYRLCGDRTPWGW